MSDDFRRRPRPERVWGDPASIAQPRPRRRKVDCIDGTPLIDIKPYFASTDSHPDARRP